MKRGDRVQILDADGRPTLVRRGGPSVILEGTVVAVSERYKVAMVRPDGDTDTYQYPFNRLELLP